MLVFNQSDEDIADAKASATIVVVRDGDRGIEALLLKRNSELSHMPDAWVFPGGKVDADDPGVDELERARAAAVRELEEEAGLVMAPDSLRVFSHWLTPVVVKRRFSTWFWLAPVKGETSISVDGSEIVEHRWVTAVDALDENNTGRLALPPPTLVTLCDVAAHASVDALASAVSQRQPPHFFPKIIKRESDFCFLYPGDAGYEQGEPETVGPRHRSQIIDGAFSYCRDYDWPPLSTAAS